MKYFSTNNSDQVVTFREGILRGLAPDKGLYFPQDIPRLSNDVLASFENMALGQIGAEIMSHYVGDLVGRDELGAMMADALDFPIPLVEVEEGIWSLELFHGPTMAFKDVGARTMSRMLAATGQGNSTVLVATSGDTGSAVANGFLGVEGIEVIILYPKGKVSKIQEKQLTTLGQNITAIEVEGVFDDCQAMVKQAFLDNELNQHMALTSANSINLARWIPQSIYYFHALNQLPLSQLERRRRLITGKTKFSVPSGNYGNITAGILARTMGLNCGGFIAATNANTIVPDFLSGGDYSPKSSKATIANAMDVGDPSNFVRMRELYDRNDNKMRAEIGHFSMADEDIFATIKDCYERTGYILDPHGAIGYKAIKNAGGGIFLETAHPAKFKDTVEKAIGHEIELPPALQETFVKEGDPMTFTTGFGAFKEYLLTR